MKKKALPVGTMFLVLVIALAVLGVGYALWSETLTIQGTVQTGEVDVEFSTHPVEECIDINGVLTCPEPPEKADAANCTVEWLGGDTDPNGDNGANLLQVSVTGMYPSYHCKVGFDVTSTGNVPVHVWLPEATGDIPAWVATNFEGCYTDGVQLHEGQSTGLCTMDIHFTNDQAPPENSGPITFGWTILATQFNEDPVAPGPVVLLEDCLAPFDGPVGANALSMGGACYRVEYNPVTDTLDFFMQPTLPTGEPTRYAMQAFSTGLRDAPSQVSDVDLYTIKWGSSDGNPPVEPIYVDAGGGWYSYSLDASGLHGTPLSVLYMVNVREDNARDLQRFFGVTAMTTPNAWGGFDWTWANRLPFTVP